MEPIIGMFTELQNSLLLLGPIVAVVGVLLWFIMNAIGAIWPEAAANARGVVQKILFGCLIAGGATTIVGAFWAMGGGGAVVP